MSDGDAQITSRYPLLEKPELQSTIPAHMMAKLTESERYLVSTVSKLEQQNAWLMEHTIANNHALVEIDVWRQMMDRWKTALTSKWAVVAIVGAVIIPAAFAGFFEWLFPAIFHH